MEIGITGTCKNQPVVIKNSWRKWHKMPDEELLYDLAEFFKVFRFNTYK